MLNDEYTDSDFRAELQRFFKSRMFNVIEAYLVKQMTDELIAIPASDETRLVNQKRKLEALNDLIGTMRHLNNETTLEELNA